ncbi:hypothetical protein FKP32DRAFT_1676746 [Trametes sanguinea]|nr:hypothetical protein FKP32DRAFT_1676746 [Trametes sanguinea]
MLHAALDVRRAAYNAARRLRVEEKRSYESEGGVWPDRAMSVICILEIQQKLRSLESRLSRLPSSCVWQLSQEEEHEDSAEVTWEDQQRINSFSKLNTRLRGIEEKIQELKEKEALDDISMELELADEDEPVMYRIGEAFIHMPHARAVKRLERDLAALNAELEKQTSNAEDCEKQMKELKVILYAKFGRAINLDE